MRKKDCWVVVSAKDEARRIKDVVRGVRKEGFRNVVVVDDGSSDATAGMAKPAVVLQHIVNLGKGAAMKTGAEYALQQGAKAIIFMDGDGQHRPSELPRFLEELKDADIVFGMRKERKDMPLERRLGSWILSAVIRHFYNIRLSDPLCGYRAVTRTGYEKIKWESRDYSVEGEMIARAGRELLEHSEIEVKTIYHNRYKGMTVPHGLRIVAQLVWWRMTH